MNRNREKVLFYITVGVMAAGMGFILYFKALLQPAREDRAQAAEVRLQNEELELRIARGENDRRRLARWASASFGFEELKASEAIRAHLLGLIQHARLDPAQVTMAPVSGRRLKGGREIGWTVRAKGPQDRVIDLLFLLQSDPRLHRVESVSWSPVPRSTELELSLKYTTIVLDLPPGLNPPELAAVAPGADLTADPSRSRYALIAQRDLFRPYIKRPPPPPPPPSQAPPPPVNRAAQLKLVGLPAWRGESVAVVRDTQANATRTYKLGEDLIGGEIVMIDYRPLPRADKPYLNSPSRVIVRIGREHWAVELGQTLAEKRKLPESQVPEPLREELAAYAPTAGEAPQASADAAGAQTSEKGPPASTMQETSDAP